MEQPQRTMLSAGKASTTHASAPARKYEPRAMNMLHSILLKIASPEERDEFDCNFRLWLGIMIDIMREPGAFFADFTGEQKIWYIDSVMFEKCYPGVKYPEPCPPTRDEVRRAQTPEPQTAPEAEGSPMPHQVPEILEMARRAMPLKPVAAPWNLAATQPNLWATMLSGAGGDGGDPLAPKEDFTSNEDIEWNDVQFHHRYPLPISAPRHALRTLYEQRQIPSDATNTTYARLSIPAGPQQTYNGDGLHDSEYPSSSYLGDYQPTSRGAAEYAGEGIEAIQAGFSRRGRSQLQYACNQPPAPPVQLYLPDQIHRLRQRDPLNNKTWLAPTSQPQQRRNGSFPNYQEPSGC